MKRTDYLLIAILALILAVTASLLLGCGHHRHGGGAGFSPPFPSPALITPTSAREVAQVPEHITDLCRVGKDIFFSPYLHYSNGKLYRWNGSLHAMKVPGRFESIYRVWWKNGLYMTTEQPPGYFKTWHRTLYAGHGWGVLGNLASDGSSWHGWSYRNQNTHMWRDDKPFPSLGKRIVWWVESYAGKYYAGTSGTTTYHNANDGRIYVWENGWKVVPTGAIGGAITLRAFKDALYVGTVHPQSILRYDGKTWQRWDFSGSGEVAKFWSDERGDFFTATTEGGKIHLRQWNGKTWPEVWSIVGKSEKWGPQGCAKNNIVTLAFWSGGKTRIWQIQYK